MSNGTKFYNCVVLNRTKTKLFNLKHLKMFYNCVVLNRTKTFCKEY